jgi:hypothetical protein
LKLKRVVSKGGAKKEKSDGLISRHTGGLCFDIFDDDKSMLVFRIHFFTIYISTIKNISYFFYYLL